MERIKRFLKDEEGVTMIEYALLAGLIAVALVTVIGTLKGNLSTLFTTIGTSI
ncbi:MAG: Flp family type IVb pilin [Syntrophorhabdales bacterium]|jgi:pilus assembly protein Flp/PilA